MSNECGDCCSCVCECCGCILKKCPCCLILVYPWLKICKCCRCDFEDDQKKSKKRIQKELQKKRIEDGDKHRQFRRKLDEKRSKEEEDWLERSGLRDFLESDEETTNGKSKFDGIAKFENFFDRKIFEAEDEFDRVIAKLAADGKDNIVTKNIEGLRVSIPKDTSQSQRPQLSMSNRNLERIRNDYLSDQIRKKDMEAHIKDVQKRKALRARKRKKMERQHLGFATTNIKINKNVGGNQGSQEESVVTDIHNEFRQDLKRRSQETELIRNKQLENTKKRKENRKEKGHSKNTEVDDETNFEFM